MTNKKRYLSMAALALACALAFTGCGDDPAGSENIVGRGAEFLLNGGNRVRVVVKDIGSRSTAAEAAVEEKDVYFQEGDGPIYKAKGRIRKEGKAITATAKAGTVIYNLDGKLDANDLIVPTATALKKEEESASRWGIALSTGTSSVTPQESTTLTGSSASPAASIFHEAHPLKGYWWYEFQIPDLDDINEEGEYNMIDTYIELFFNDYSIVEYTKPKARYEDRGVISVEKINDTTYDVIRLNPPLIGVDTDVPGVYEWIIVPESEGGITRVNKLRYVIQTAGTLAEYFYDSNQSYEDDSYYDSLATYNQNPAHFFDGYTLPSGEYAPEPRIYTRP